MLQKIDFNQGTRNIPDDLVFSLFCKFEGATRCGGHTANDASQFQNCFSGGYYKPGIARPRYSTAISWSTTIRVE